MKKDMMHISKSSFMSLEKDFNTIVTKLLGNSNLKKLLYYTTPDALSKPSLNQEQTLSLINKNIKIVPKVIVDETIENYIIINFDNFTPDANNPEYRDNLIIFDIICHYNQWNLGDFRLRPYKIAGEIDGMLDKAKLSGIGELNFRACDILTINDQMAGLVLVYSATHGGDDQDRKIVNA